MKPRSNSQRQLDQLYASRHPDRIARDAIVSQLHTMYIATERDARLEAAFHELISVSARNSQAEIETEGRVVGRLAEARSLWLLGESGAGKTRALQRIFGKIPQFANYRTDRGATPLVSVTVPSPFTLRQFAQDLAAACGYDTNSEMRENQAWQLARNLIRGRVSFIHIDEAHNFLENNNPIERTKARNALRGFVSSFGWPVCLILSGLPYSELLAEDFQLFRRRAIVKFGAIDLEGDRAVLRGAFISFCERANVQHAGVLRDDSTLERLCYAAEHQFGVTIELMQDAIMHALDKKADRVGIADFALAYHLRSGCTETDNVITMTEGWRGVIFRPGSSSDILSERGSRKRPGKGRRL